MTHQHLNTAKAPEVLSGPDAAAQLLKVVYLAQPDDRSFMELVELWGENPEKLIDCVWQAKPLQLKHLTWALYFARRGLEASFFAEQWCSSEPENSDAWKVASLLACEHAMPAEAREAINSFCARNSHSQTSYALTCAYALVFNMPQDALTCAHHICETFQELEPLAIGVCFDAAVRFDDSDLALELCSRGYAKNENTGSKRYNFLTRILRQRLVSTIAKGPHDSKLQRQLDDVARWHLYA